MKALASIRQSQLVVPRLRAVLLPIALLLPLWTVGIFGRSYWKPDEPREAAIVWRMHQSGNTAVPSLAGTPFLEKPPLLYWAAQPFMSEGRAAAWRARVPNLIYASIAALCVFLLASELMSATAATAATLITSSFLLNYQVSIWLATDAPLMAGVALSLLGLYRGYCASDTRTKLAYYTLMHGGLAFAFMAKSAAAWLVPGCAFLTLLLLDRNFRELLRWQLYAGAVIELACIGSWLWSVSQAPHGRELLEQVWMNLAGRFANLQSTLPGVPQYTQEHRNWFGKYFLEAPYFVFPWTLIVIAAVRRAWCSMREGTHVRAWRFCIAATLPALLLLSIARTGRDIYAAPLLIGMGIACGLWIDAAEAEPKRIDTLALRGSRWLIVLLAVLAIAALPLSLEFTHAESMATWPTLVGACILAFALVRSFVPTVTHASTSERVIALYSTYVLVIVGVSLAHFPMLNRQQDLLPIGAALRADLHGQPLVLVTPDETTRAFIDLEGLTVQQLTRPASLDEDTRNLLQTQPQTRFLIQTRERHGPLADRFGRNTRRRSSKDDVLDALTQMGLSVEKRYSIPDGRSYALLAHAS